jgi:hypothetical protein
MPLDAFGLILVLSATQSPVWGFLLASALFLCWHPRGAFAARALPLCGAAPTFLCRGKEK